MSVSEFSEPKKSRSFDEVMEEWTFIEQANKNPRSLWHRGLFDCGDSAVKYIKGAAYRSAWGMRKVTISPPCLLFASVTVP